MMRRPLFPILAILVGTGVTTGVSGCSTLDGAVMGFHGGGAELRLKPNDRDYAVEKLGLSVSRNLRSANMRMLIRF